MAHVYVVTSNSFVPGPADPQVTIVGTVDGIAVTITMWKSAYDQHRAIGLASLEAVVAQLMLTAANAIAPPAPVQPVNQITGTFTL
jgi:hypothetical protein